MQRVIKLAVEAVRGIMALKYTSKVLAQRVSGLVTLSPSLLTSPLLL